LLARHGQALHNRDFLAKRKELSQLKGDAKWKLVADIMFNRDNLDAKLTEIGGF
jgi:hypothetical protein